MHNGIKFRDIVPRWQKPPVKFKRKLLNATIHIFAWIGMAILYYFAFSFFFDTPVEYQMKASTRKLKKEYTELSMRYDTISKVLDNVIERDKSVFRILFESEPYSFENENDKIRLETHEALLSKTNKELAQIFFSKLNSLDKKASQELHTLYSIEQKADSIKNALNFIPAIQPVINNELTLLTASYGMRIQPFYKTLASHQGVDYTVSEGSRVFATADGSVKNIVTQRTSSGNSVTIDHGNGYQTVYNHLNKIVVRKGQQVRRGDIIAQSGNTGLSLAPHLHYEIRHNGMRIDPIHYFFMELDYNQYQKIIKIAQTGMQSFD